MTLGHDALSGAPPANIYHSVVANKIQRGVTQLFDADEQLGKR